MTESELAQFKTLMGIPPHSQEALPLPGRLETFNSLPDVERQRIRLRAMRTGGFETPEDLSRQIAAYVRILCFEGSPVKFASLNRRFCRAARKVGYKLNDLLDALVANGALTATVFQGNTLFVDKQYLEDRERMVDDAVAHITNIDEQVKERMSFNEKFYKNAQ